jgi:uncharacterized membrane protein YfcA
MWVVRESWGWVVENHLRYKRVNLLMLPAIILGVFVPMALEGPLRWLSLASGAALVVAAVVAFFSTSKSAQEDRSPRRADRARAHRVATTPGVARLARPLRWLAAATQLLLPVSRQRSRPEMAARAESR